MKRLAFPTLFAIVLLGFWVFSKAPGGATSPTPFQQQSSPSSAPQLAAPTPEPLTEKEEMFAATLSVKNQEIFTKMMSKKQRTMAMEMVIENNRTGGGLSSDQVVDQLSEDLHLSAPAPNAVPNSMMSEQPPSQGISPAPITPPSASASPAKPAPQPPSSPTIPSQPPNNPPKPSGQ